MNRPQSAEIWDALDATWPARRTKEVGGFLIRDGSGGGKRVSAATALGTTMDVNIAEAEVAMTRLGQRKLFMIRDTDAELDAELDARGYQVIDPVSIYMESVEHLGASLPPITVFTVWKPLAIQLEMWTEGGIDPARHRVMGRARGPKTSLFGRLENRPAGTGFVSSHGKIAMVHALEVRPDFRNRGLGRMMMRGAANWGQREGAEQISLAVTRANKAANALYASMGMSIVEQYHYRMKE